jgi:outer membrane protein
MKRNLKGCNPSVDGRTGTNMKGDNMRLSAKWFVFFFIGLLVFIDAGLAADVAKIGVVEFQRVIEGSEAGKAIKAKMTTQYERMESELKGKESEIKELKKRMDRESLVMSKEMREEKDREFRIKVNDIKMLQKKYEAELQEMNKRLMGDLIKDSQKIIAEIGKAGGYLAIINKSAVLYSPSTIDITDEVVKRYNASYAKTKK